MHEPELPASPQTHRPVQDPDSGDDELDGTHAGRFIAITAPGSRSHPSARRRPNVEAADDGVN